MNRRPSADTDPRDICPDCENGIVMFAATRHQSACTNLQCKAVHGHIPPLRDWRKDGFVSGVFTAPKSDAPVVGWVNVGGSIDRTGGDAAFILALLSQMTESARYESIKSIIERYCQHCGTSNKPSRCQCWDDE